jgi:hypothetical protein
LISAKLTGVMPSWVANLSYIRELGVEESNALDSLSKTENLRVGSSIVLLSTKETSQNQDIFQRHEIKTSLKFDFT